MPARMETENNTNNFNNTNNYYTNINNANFIRDYEHKPSVKQAKPKNSSESVRSRNEQIKAFEEKLELINKSNEDEKDSKNINRIALTSPNNTDITNIKYDYFGETPAASNIIHTDAIIQATQKPFNKYRVKSKKDDIKTINVNMLSNISQNPKTTAFDPIDDGFDGLGSEQRIRKNEDLCIPNSSILKNNTLKNIINIHNNHNSNSHNNNFIHDGNTLIISNTQANFNPKININNQNSSGKRVNKTPGHSSQLNQNESRINLRKLNKIERAIYYNLLKTIERDNEFKDCLQITHDIPIHKYDDGRSK